MTLELACTLSHTAGRRDQAVGARAQVRSLG